MVIDNRLRRDNPTKYYLKKTKSVTVIRTCHDVSTCWHFFSEKTVTIDKKSGPPQADRFFYLVAVLLYYLRHCFMDHMWFTQGIIV
ncbi:hypothetical protein SAMN05428949_3630 [Chitinophaga sp. YR627]|nr:hypothetical protein SAMN05428949_3630 [Chitinophaga sp. YR627]